jgi:hypothetical protein
MAKVSQNISSDSLFHFIKRREWLLSILKKKSFQARYVYEDIPEIKYKVGIPMKCFCDIPLGMIKKHLSNYGKFGIGITKEYAKKNTFSPVIYIHENSDTLKRYLKSMKKTDIFNDPHSLLPYFKIDERKRNTSPGRFRRDRFYDEREWRYIPYSPIFIDFTGFDEEEIRKTRLDYENKNIDNDKLKYVLPFEYADITYIFVQQQEDVDKVIEEIRSTKIEQLQQDRLIAKIITSRQIERDF